MNQSHNTLLSDPPTSLSGHAATGARPEPVLGRWSDLFDRAPVLIAYLNAAGCYQHVSAAYSSWGGQTRGFYLGRHYGEVLPLLFAQPHRSRFIKAISSALSGIPSQAEGALFSGRYVQADYTPDIADDGTVLGVLVIKTDVTGLKSARTEALEARERLSLAAHTNGMGIWSNDLSEARVCWDDACYALVGMDPHEGVPSFDRFRQRIHPDDREQHVTAFRQAQRGEGDYDSEYRVLQPDGTWRWLNSRGRVLLDESGKPERMLGVVFDITRHKRAEQVAREERERVHQILESTTDAVVMVNQNWEFTYLNSNAIQLLSHGRHLLGVCYWDAFPDVWDTNFGKTYRATMEDGQPRMVEEYYPSFDQWFRVHVYRSADGLVAFFSDVTERRKATELLRLHRQVIESVPMGVSIVEFSAEKDFPLVYSNPAFETMTGYPSSEVLGRHLRFLRGKDAVTGRLSAALESGRSSTQTVRSYRKDGTWFLNEVQVSPVPDQSGKVTHMVAIHNDVTEITDTRQRLARQALYDALTGIPNRYLFIDRLQEAIAAAQRTGERLAVIYIDIDNLKHVNDSLGHVQGDRLLKEVATRISACTLEHSSLARLGGDEFALFCTGYRDQAELERLMSRIVQRVAQPMELDGKEWIVTGSAGYALFPEHGTNADDLLRMADLAMYSAKRETKNSWHAYHPGLDHGRNRHLDIASGLRRAVAEDEFFLLYQPRIDSRTGKLKCMEALIRWNHPDMGVLLPAQFILTAEETGMIREIGLWVIQEAIRQNQQWRREGRAAVPISVNVSPVQFRSPHFAASVMQLLRDAGLPPSLLELEVTESLLMDESISGEPLKHLRQSGVRISIDDFGTGYSGLGYLTRFSVDTLKVDRSFTQNICNLPGAAAICESILQLARKLNLTTVAEGVEQDAQANLLRNWGCSELQGYYFGRPMPATQIEGMLQSA